MNWININEKQPTNNKNVLVVISRKSINEPIKREIHVGHNTGNFWIIGGQFGFDMGKVTHWMELPKLPKD